MADETTAAITVSHLRKSYGHIKAIDDVSFSVDRGEIFGLLGPNGAGKTTTVECLIGLRHADVGSIQVLGLDPQVDQKTLHSVVGVQLQFSAFPDKLRVAELFDLYQSFYPNPVNPKDLIDGLGLGGKLGSFYKDLSGGQKQRLSVALALIGQPKLAVLDEMTTGLDPHARLDVWELIESINKKGVTIILVTHFMEEAERLCDRVALMDKGHFIALDTPRALADKVVGGKRVRFVPSKGFPDSLLTKLPEVSTLLHQGKRIEVSGAGDLVNAVILTLNAKGIEAKDVSMEAATLEEAFIKLTGRRLHEAEESRRE
jgi:ABC-2 type transport system ATP-binding protein